MTVFLHYFWTANIDFFCCCNFFSHHPLYLPRRLPPPPRSAASTTLSSSPTPLTDGGTAAMVPPHFHPPQTNHPTSTSFSPRPNHNPPPPPPSATTLLLYDPPRVSTGPQTRAAPMTPPALLGDRCYLPLVMTSPLRLTRQRGAPRGVIAYSGTQPAPTPALHSPSTTSISSGPFSEGSTSLR